MFKSPFISAALISLFVGAGAIAQSASAQTVEIDPSKSALSWEGRKVIGPHNGTINMKSGSIELKGNEIVGGKMEIDMTSIKDLDLTDPTYNTKLITHLKSEDFFDVAKFPTATIVIKSVKAHKKADDKDLNNVDVVADVTIKAQTHPANFPAIASVKDGVATAEGTIEIDRTIYGVKYNSGKFFSLEKLGDKAINDKFKVMFKVVAEVPAAAGKGKAKAKATP